MPVSQPVSAGNDPDASIPDLIQLDESLKRSLKILIIDDERTLRESCRTFLESEGYPVDVCGKGKEALDVVTRRPFDIILIDQYMADVPGTELLQACLARNPDTIAIVMTGNPSVQSSIEMLRAGAWDYLTKPFSATQLQILIGRAANTVLVARESQEQADAVAKQYGNSEKVTVLGVAPTFRSVIEQARQVARTDASVFLTGESGTGKELIAQFIHPPQQPTDGGHQLRGSPRDAPRVRDVRPPQGGVHRRGAGQAWPAGDSQRRHDVPGRGHRDVQADPGQAAAGHPGRRRAAGGE
jgi:DNA-binding response OmpR family regulator